jgi:hemolysin D
MKTVLPNSPLEAVSKAADACAPQEKSPAAGVPDVPVRPRRAPKLSALEKEFLPPLLEIQETPPSPLQRWVMFIIVALVVTLIVWSVIGKLEIVATATGKIIPDGRVKVIQPIGTSIIRAIHVKDGQEVKEGDLLVELDPTVSTADLDAGQRKVAILRERVKSAHALVGIGALSKKDFKDMERELATQEAETVQAKQKYDLEWLRAPVAGVVQNVAITTLGSVVTSAQTLVTIVPKGTPLIVEASLSNEDVGFVKIGQNVDIKLDTFPFQQYGTIQGTVTWVSPDAEDTAQSTMQSTPDNTNAPAGASAQSGKSTSGPNNNKTTGLTYRVQIALSQLTIDINGRKVPLTAGMSLKADIITDSRRVIDFFLSPVVKYLDEGLKVR